MNADFDIAATDYDENFTHSHIGNMQRKRVWRLLENTITQNKSLNILELNCGTGEDAISFASQGHKVTATDISKEMLKVAMKKDQLALVDFRELDLNNIDNFHSEKQYDLIFSNFGGLNCIDSVAMGKLSKSLGDLLRPGGKFIAVIMPKFCVWEICYFLLKGKVNNAFRRKREYAMADVSGKMVKTWYYSPKSHQSLMGNVFEVVQLKPIGLFVPPSYLENFFAKRLRLLKLFNALEKYIANFSWQSNLADHYYIEYNLK